MRDCKAKNNAQITRIIYENRIIIKKGDFEYLGADAGARLCSVECFVHVLSQAWVCTSPTSSAVTSARQAEPTGAQAAGARIRAHAHRRNPSAPRALSCNRTNTSKIKKRYPEPNIFSWLRTWTEGAGVRDTARQEKRGNRLKKRSGRIHQLGRDGNKQHRSQKR